MQIPTGPVPGLRTHRLTIEHLMVTYGCFVFLCGVYVVNVGVVAHDVLMGPGEHDMGRERKHRP